VLLGNITPFTIFAAFDAFYHYAVSKLQDLIQILTTITVRFINFSLM